MKLYRRFFKYIDRNSKYIGATTKAENKKWAAPQKEQPTSLFISLKVLPSST